MEGGEEVLVTPGEILGKESDIKAGRGAYVAPHNRTIYASLSGRRIFIHPSPHSPDQRPIVEVVGHKAHGAVPEPGSVVIARVTKVMARAASADIMCVGPKSVREKFTGTIRWKHGSNQLDGDAMPIDGPSRTTKGCKSVLVSCVCRGMESSSLKDTMISLML
ncbi:uncharacterized protein LOC131240617 isoform X2 [Magnolia sinica]|uniref:uncharacterized protein LOC131240617 isoform X2 n=1 Tax=Magnolia sinica TaxID=86752 RepID=UPI002659AE35|nr:uncharacterized protein LOC131240617 isoform X2 [Magnolia sinica]